MNKISDLPALQKINEFNSDYQYAVKTDHIVDPLYRTANHYVTDINLVGKEGLDLIITRSYNSLSSKILSPQYTVGLGNYGETPQTENIIGFIATGWALNLPYMQLTNQIPDVLPKVIACSTVNNACDTSPQANIPKSGFLTQYTLQSSQKEKVIFTLEDGSTIEFRNGLLYNYPYENVTYTKTNGQPVMHKLTINEALTYTFDEAGRMISKENQYADKVSYHYNSNQLDGNENIVITDSYQRQITIFRKPDLNFPNRPPIITGIKVMHGTNVVKEIKYDVSRAATDLVYRNWNEETDEVEIIEKPQLGYWKLNKVTDLTNGSQILESYDYYPVDTTRLADFNFKSDGYAYSSDAEGNPSAYDAASCPDPNKLCYTKQWRWSGDDQYVESDSVVQMNNHRYGEIAYSLLKNIYFYNGLTVKYNYQSYNAGWSASPEYTQKEQYRGSTRLYTSPHALSYFGYHAVDRVDYIYNEDNQSKMISNYYRNLHQDHGWQFNEYWQQDKSQIPRLRNSSRYGDKQITIEQQQVGKVLDATYRLYHYEPGDTQLLLKYSWMAPWNYNMLETVEDHVQYTNHNHLITKYGYDTGLDQPSKIWSYVGNVDDVCQPPEPTKLDVKETYSYDNWGRILSYIDIIGNVTTNRYEGPFRQLSFTSTESTDHTLVTNKQLDYYRLSDPEISKRGQLKKITNTQKYPNPENNGEQIISSFTTDVLLYDKNRNAIQTKQYSTDNTLMDTPPLAERRYTYTSLGQLESLMEAAEMGGNYNFRYDLKTSYKYDIYGNIIEASYPDGSRTTATYDLLGRMTSTIYKNQKKVYNYLDSERKVSITLPDGEIQNNYYSPFGLPVKGERIVAGTTRTSFINKSSDGQLIDEELPFGESSLATMYSYDSLGRQKTITNSLGHKTEYYYSNTAIEGHVESRSTNKVLYPDGTVEFNYLDKYGRVDRIVSQIPEMREEINNTYTDYGDVVEQEVNAFKNDNLVKSQTTRYAFDTNHQLIYLKDAENNIHRYTYNYLGGLVDYKLNGQLQKHNTYNAIGWNITTTDASGKFELIEYNKLGLPVTITDKKGNSIINTYTTLNEIDTVTVKEKSKEIYKQKYQYDELTRLLVNSISTESSVPKSETITYSYDPWKRLETQIVAGRSYKFVYDDWDRLTSIIYPDEQVQTYQYDTLNRLLSVSYADMGTVTYDYSIGPHEMRYKIMYPNSFTLSKVSNGFGQVTFLTHNRSSINTYSEEYFYDGMGNISSIDRIKDGNTVKTSFQYDQLNRITSELSPLGQTQYRYDVRGNREQLSSTAEDIQPQYSDVTYSYNGVNMLNEIAVREQGVRALYTYYADGLRATKTVGDVRTRYVYYNGRVIEELGEDTQGNITELQARNIWGNELLFRKDYRSNQGGYYQYNGHGDVIQITDKSGNVINSYEYDIWGNVTSNVENITNPFRYTGEILDEESGLYYLRARNYDPADGRFITEDTYEGELGNPLSLNLYTYVENNPLIYTDPSGHVKASDNEVLSNMVLEFTDDWNRAKKKGDFGRMQEAERDADRIRVSYYRMFGLNIPDDVRYTDVSDKQQSHFRVFFFALSGAPMPDKNFLNLKSNLNINYIMNNPQLLFALGPEHTEKVFTQSGYKVEMSPQKSGNGVKLIIGGHKEIGYIQFSNGQGRHGLPYIKVAGNLNLPGNTLKIVQGLRSDYKGNIQAEEKAGTRFIWWGGKWGRR
ncbi:RHS repeat domain-containing protein [Paenibacillus sp. 1001270B_150601_E10]|uniref:RHS repeat domain-containing protein n=1 Tax=Paenibacillus sp. 1001270B_150601_E10 TaxID=2787079 RepID=UPI0018A07AA6|nr:RHS repeat-associated core domain-containing protein [Paenibacillus sp. 1001270B_150601_E10]